MTLNIRDYPKLHSPFKRVQAGKKYVVTNELEPGYEWIFDDGVKAVDKLHGTNLCLVVMDGKVTAIDNRDTRIFTAPFDIPIKNVQGNRFLEGVLAASQKGWLEDTEGYVYGELIGPHINGNMHKTTGHLFVPFQYLQSKCHWRSWISNQYPKDFDSISAWFKDLPSLFSDRVCKESVLAEGLVFYHPNGKRCKLRRDMFEWYEGEQHKE